LAVLVRLAVLVCWSGLQVRQVWLVRFVGCAGLVFWAGRAGRAGVLVRLGGVIFSLPRLSRQTC